MSFNYDLRNVENRSQLLTYLDLEEIWLDQVLNFDPEEYKSFLRKKDQRELPFWPFMLHSIPKRNKSRGRREVWEASPVINNQFKSTARRLHAFFSFVEKGYPHENSYGYVKGRNTRQNATRHVGNSRMLKCDIREFFSSIDRRQIEELFCGLGVASEVSSLLARYITIGDRLPLGLATSPAITNIICLPLDHQLTALAEECAAIYTRYADDITFSGNSSLPAIEEVEAAINACGFQLAKEKTRYSRIGQAHYVTGLSVSDELVPHAPRAMKRKLRQELHYAKNFGLDEHFERIGIVKPEEQRWEVNRLDGLVKYVSHHEPRHSRRLHTQWRGILQDSGRRPSFESKNRNRVPIAIFADETEIEWDGETYLALCLTVSQHQDQIDLETAKLLSDFLASPWGDGKTDAIRTNGLHFTDATEDLRLKYIQKLQTLPFTGYVSIVKLSSSKKYGAAYIRLVNSLIRRRLIAADGQIAFFCFEENDKVPFARIRDSVDNAVDELRQEKNRCPSDYKVTSVSKSRVGVSVPDFLLGVLRKYLISGNPDDTKPLRREHMMFERLRDKFKVVVNIDTNEEFSRRNPIRPWVKTDL